MTTAFADFTEAEIERARRYHRPAYVALLADLALGLGVLAALAFGWPGDRLYGTVEDLPWWASTPSFAALVLSCSTVIGLPIAFWRGHLHERDFGLSTQSASHWLGDRAKGLGIGVVLTALALLGLVAAARSLPGAWPVVAAPAAALLTLLLSFVAPLLLEPLFNRFEPLADADLAAELRALAETAGVPVSDVLVADASRRTRKENAYVSGLGRTRRVVVYDTLLARASPRELRLVTAHELAHRRERHVAKATLLAALGAVVGVLVVWGVTSWPAALGAAGASGAGDPRVIPLVLLTGSVLELVSLPFLTALSRRWERVADRASLELTGDLEAFEATHLGLARANLSDLDPPKAVYYTLLSHPTAPERLEEGRRFVRTALPLAAPTALHSR